jgi:hypothetical protein
MRINQLATNSQPKRTLSWLGGESRPPGLPPPQAHAARACNPVLTPLELLDRLALLIPPPRRHRHRYHGVFAPNAPLRAQVTVWLELPADTPSTSAAAPNPAEPSTRPPHPLWPAQFAHFSITTRIVDEVLDIDQSHARGILGNHVSFLRVIVPRATYVILPLVSSPKTSVIIWVVEKMVYKVLKKLEPEKKTQRLIGRTSSTTGQVCPDYYILQKVAEILYLYTV